MTNDRSGPKAPTEHPDPAAAAQGGSGQDRAGFDLGGAKDKDAGGAGTTIPGGPKGGVGQGSDAAGHASGAGNRGSAAQPPASPDGSKV